MMTPCWEDREYVSPSPREREVLGEAITVATRLGLRLPPGTYQVRWFVDGWREDLAVGEVDCTGRRPVAVYLKSGRINEWAPTEIDEAAEAVFRTICHELQHVYDVLTRPLPLDVEEREARAEAFADRAVAERRRILAEWQQLLAGRR